MDATAPRSGFPVFCPFCESNGAELLPMLGDHSDYKCMSCGEFSVDGDTERLFEVGRADPKMAGFVEVNGRMWLRP